MAQIIPATRQRLGKLGRQKATPSDPATTACENTDAIASNGSSEPPSSESQSAEPDRDSALYEQASEYEYEKKNLSGTELRTLERIRLVLVAVLRLYRAQLGNSGKQLTHRLRHGNPVVPPGVQALAIALVASANAERSHVIMSPAQWEALRRIAFRVRCGADATATEDLPYPHLRGIRGLASSCRARGRKRKNRRSGYVESQSDH